MKIKNLFLKILKKSLGIIFLLQALGGILAIFEVVTNIPEFVFCVILTVILFILAYLCLKKEKNISNNTTSIITDASHTDIPSAEKTDLYTIDNNTIYRTDGKEISDQEIPYLIQLGYEHAFQAEANSSNPKFHRTAREDDLSYDFESKYYNEISERTKKFKNLYRDSYTEINLSKKILLLEEALIDFDKCKKYCYSKGKGGQIYFQDTYEYLDSSQNPCFSYRDMITDSLEELYFERDELIPDIKNALLQHDGILQKNIYQELPQFERSDIQRMLRKLEKENIITRFKKSGSYELHLNGHE